MAKFKKRAPSAPKTPYSSTRKKNRKLARAKRITAREKAHQQYLETIDRVNNPSTPSVKTSKPKKSVRWVEEHFPEFIPTRPAIDTTNLLLDKEDDKRELSQAEKLNAAMEYASDKFGNRNDYSKYLLPLIGEMTNEDFMKTLMTDPKSAVGDYKDFTIDDDFDGNLNNLFKYIHFKNIPPEVSDSYIENIIGLEWSTPEAYNNHVQEINDKIYASNLKDEGIEINSTYYMLLESVMQSSAAWNIAKRNAYDSDQVKSNWLTLYSAGMEASDMQNTNPGILDKFEQMVVNEESLDVIISTIDNAIAAALKG